jgi:cell division protease FtsH
MTHRADAPLTLGEFMLTDILVDYDDPIPVEEEALVVERNTMELVAELAIKAAIPALMRRRIQGTHSIALVVEVPSAAWVVPVAAALIALGPWHASYPRDGSRRYGSDRAKESEAVAYRLSRGERVMGVSHAPDAYLPATLVSGADVRIRIGPLSDAAIASLIKRVTGRRPATVPAGVGALLDPQEIAAAVRGGDDARAGDCVRRLAATARAKVGEDASLASVPPFESLLGLGPLHDFGIRLIAGIETWRKGEAPFPEDRPAVIYSQPGLGKSTAIKSLAKSASIKFIQSPVADWFTGSSGNLDGVLKYVNNVFSESGRAIIFLDELDALPDRRSLSERGRDWWLPVCNSVLLQIDRINARKDPVCIIGATNFKERIDPALVRPGRLGRILTIEPPDAVAMAGILRQHLGDDLPGVDLTIVAELGAGSTGADAVSWIRDARDRARAAVRPLAIGDLVEAVAPKAERSPEELHRLAVHEAGHAILAEFGVGHVISVGIVAREGEAGRMTASTSFGRMPTRRQLELYAIGALGGRAAETVILGEPSVGGGGSAGSDLAQATRILAGLHASAGLGDRLLYTASLDEAADRLSVDPDLRKAVERDLRILQDEADEMIRRFRPAVEAVAERLLERRVLDGDTVREIIAAAAREPHMQGG